MTLEEAIATVQASQAEIGLVVLEENSADGDAIRIVVEAVALGDLVRRDPAVLAALPEVQAMVAAAVEQAAREIDCEGCRGNCVDPANCHAEDARIIRLITSTDAKAALEAHTAREVAKALEGVIREMEANWGHVVTPELRDAIRALILEVKP